MKFISSIYVRSLVGLYIFLLIIQTSGCQKFVEIPLPVNAIAGNAAFTTDKSTAAVLNNIYGTMAGSTTSGFFSSTNGVGFSTGLYSDEIVPVITSSIAFAPFYTDLIDPNGGTSGIWTNFYKQVYNANTVIEGVNSSTTLVYKNQWLGEALFLRAWCYFYLTNLFGDVPLALTTDYTINNTLSRSPQAIVYQQIITDLKQAQTLLTDDFKNYNGVTTIDRGRPNKGAATALLARVYLYTHDWANAENAATSLINNTSAYSLVPLSQVFLANSKETIWSITLPSTVLEQDYLYYNNNNPTGNLTNISTLISAVLSPSLINAFEPGDNRTANWTRIITSTSTPGVKYYLMTKYKSAVFNAENVMLMRFAEQYLIRAEARAQLGNILNAQIDLNVVRARAGLAATTANSQVALLAAILKERQTELFSEVGHRFFDLRRTGNLDAVMTAVAPSKNAAWAGFKQFWPIPNAEKLSNPNLQQNPGY